MLSFAKQRKLFRYPWTYFQFQSVSALLQISLKEKSRSPIYRWSKE